MTNRALYEVLDTGVFNRNTREKLLLYEDQEGLSLTLYLDQQVLDHYRENDPFDRLGNHNVQEFCLVLEGISHFLYMVWNASHDRAVSMLELELQAEVDKYIMLMDCFEGQSITPGPGQLTRLLFEAGEYHDDLSHGELKRYRQAAGYARNYCRKLETKFLAIGNRSGLLSELRKFYRLTGSEKINRIDQIH